MSDTNTGQVIYLRISDDAMAPLIPAGAVVVVDPSRTPTAGECVVVAGPEGERAGLLIHEQGAAYVVAIRGAKQVELAPPLALRGVVAEVLARL